MHLTNLLIQKCLCCIIVSWTAVNRRRSAIFPPQAVSASYWQNGSVCIGPRGVWPITKDQCTKDFDGDEGVDRIPVTLIKMRTPPGVVHTSGFDFMNLSLLRRDSRRRVGPVKDNRMSSWRWEGRRDSWRQRWGWEGSSFPPDEEFEVVSFLFHFKRSSCLLFIVELGNIINIEI